MKNCKKNGINAVLGSVLFITIYFLAHIFRGEGSKQSGLVEFVVILIGSFLMFYSASLVWQYLKCLNEQTKKWKP